MAYQRTYCKDEIKIIIANQGWNHMECTGNTGCTTFHIGVKGEGGFFGQFDNFDFEGKDIYSFHLTVNA